MLLGSPKGKAAAVIVEKMKKDEKPDFVEKLGEKEEAAEDDGAVTAAEAILSAVKSGDAKGLASSFRSLMALCSDEEE